MPPDVPAKSRASPSSGTSHKCIYPSSTRSWDSLASLSFSFRDIYRATVLMELWSAFPTVIVVHRTSKMLIFTQTKASMPYRFPLEKLKPSVKISSVPQKARELLSTCPSKPPWISVLSRVSPVHPAYIACFGTGTAFSPRKELQFTDHLRQGHLQSGLLTACHTYYVKMSLAVLPSTLTWFIRPSLSPHPPKVRKSPDSKLPHFHVSALKVW